MDRIKIGHVIGKDALINGQNTVDLQATDGLDIEQVGSNITVKAPTLTEHVANVSNPHGVTAAQVGADAAGTAEAKANQALQDAKDYTDNQVATSETPSGAQAKANAALADAKNYTDQKLTDLIGAAPEELDTLKEIADQLGDDSDAISAINATLATKASTDDLNAHVNDTDNPHGVTPEQIGAETPTGAQEKANAALADAKEYADTAIGNESGQLTTQLKAYVDEQVATSETPTGAQTKADAAQQAAEGYTDDAILDMMGEVSENMDTLEKIEGVVNTKAAASDLSDHIGNKSNPHEVTAEQVGADPAGTANALGIALKGGASSTMDTLKKIEDIVNTKPSATDLSTHTGNTSNPHGVTAAQVGADPAGTGASEAASALASAKSYTDGKISDLIGGAPTTMDTLKEISDAFEANEDVIDALNDAIGSKAAAADLSAHLSGLNPHNITPTSIGAATTGELSTHTGNVSNPHSVTKSQVGLGNVPNVVTNDQTPTYDDATTMATLTSGEKLSVAFGKIKKAISTLITHLSATNPHNITPASIGAAAKFVEVAVTIPASGWQGTTAPFTQDIAVSGMPATAIGDINIGNNTTFDQREAARNAVIVVTSTTAGSIALAADGEKPTIDIPAVVRYTN